MKSIIQRSLALALAPCLLAAAAGQALAASHAHAAVKAVKATTAQRSAPLRTDPATLAAIMKDDFEVQGTVASTKGGALSMDLKGIPWTGAVNAASLIDVGPYTADPSFLLAGATAKVYFHIDANGNNVIDLVLIEPTVVHGNLTAVTAVGGGSQGQVLQVLSDTKGNPTVNVDVTAATQVRILPPWDASEGIGAVNQIVAVGVSAPNGDVLAAVVVGVVSKK